MSRFRPLLLAVLLARLAGSDAAWTFAFEAVGGAPHHVTLRSVAGRIDVVLQHEADDHDHGTTGAQGTHLEDGHDDHATHHHADHIVELARFSPNATKRLQPSTAWVSLPSPTIGHRLAAASAAWTGCASAGPAPPLFKRSTVLLI